MSMDSSDPLKWYLDEISTFRSLTEEEEAGLAQHVLTGDEHAESAGRCLLEANLSVVVSIAERRCPPGIKMLDLIQEGNVGLALALKTFPGRVSERFSVYAATYIENALSKAIAESR
jgi:RNA polymerase primary sigma factor